MQIPQTSWINPAAAGAQATSQSRTDNVSSSASVPSDALAITDVEGAHKPGDRDANEQYLAQDQQSQQRGKPLKPNSIDTSNQPYTDLPADDGESHELDCWG